MAKQILKLSDLVGKTVKSVVESTQPDHVVGTRYIYLQDALAIALGIGSRFPFFRCGISHRQIGTCKRRDAPLII
jgi:hypothetical protein